MARGKVARRRVKRHNRRMPGDFQTFREVSHELRTVNRWLTALTAGFFTIAVTGVFYGYQFNGRLSAIEARLDGIDRSLARIERLLEARVDAPPPRSDAPSRGGASGGGAKEGPPSAKDPGQAGGLERMPLKQ
jgi:hypothetical protein